MSKLQKRFYTICLGILAIIFLALALTLLWVLNQEPDIRTPEYIKERAEEFLKAREQLPGTESFILVKSEPFINEDEQTPDWVLLTLAPQSDSFTGNTGSGGLIAIGRLKTREWEYNILGDTGFEDWLEQLPEDLLSEELKREFDLVKERSAVSILTPGKSVSSRLLQELALNLPWKFGEFHKVTNLPGHYHHKGTIEEAIDFGTPNGTELLAVADGTVMAIKDDSNKRGCNVEYADDANYIRIKIAPNLAILYLHTQVNSITAAGIKVGDKVAAGQPITKSGDTGFTCNPEGTGPGPHLHIVLEKLCGSKKTKVCGSAELRFEEFEAGDPRYGKDYFSENRSPQERAALKAEIKRLEEKAKKEKARQEVLTALENFYQAYTCSEVRGCSKEKVAEELEWVTENCRDRLFGFTFCLFCEEVDKLEEVGEEEYILFPTPTSETSELKIRVKSIAKETQGDEITFHYAVTNVFLVREDGRWKVDNWETTCGFVLDEEREVIYTQNLEGCEWQLQSGSW